jgi:hypothetical protein
MVMKRIPPVHAFFFIGPVLLFVLFYILTPGIVVSLPPHASKEVVAATHAVVFLVLMNVIHYLQFRQGVSIGSNVTAFVLFYVLTPGILLTIPPHGSKYEVAGVHALVFTVLQSLIMFFIRK